MLIGTRNIAQNDQRLINVDYKEFLFKGDTISTVTVTVPTGTLSTIGTITLYPDKTKVRFFVNAGASNETFTATVVMTDSNGQIVHDTLQVSVVNP